MTIAYLITGGLGDYGGGSAPSALISAGKLGYFGASYFGGGSGSSGPQTVGANSGLIEVELIAGDDYLAANGRGLSWHVTNPTGVTVAGSTCNLKFVQASSACTPFEITFTGTVTTIDSGNSYLKFDMARTDTATIPEGEYRWFVTWLGDTGETITKVFNRQLVNWKAKEV